MARKKTPTFITEIKLTVDSFQDSELLSRFQASRQLYNACLNEAMVRMELVRNYDAYKAAKKVPKDDKKKRSEAFVEARKAYRYSDYDLQAYASLVSNNSKWIAEKIDAQVVQKIYTRAFKASEKVMFGQAKKVRFKAPSRFRSVEGKTNKQGLRWKNNQVVWGSLKLNAIIDIDNLVIQHGLNSPVKYVRLLWRELNGKRRWFAQLINEGQPYQKPQNYISDGLVGLDLNISNIAYVGDSHAGLLPFAKGVATYEREISGVQRKMQRSQRVNNPDNYHPDFEGKRGRKTVTKKGKVKQGKRQWKKSANYRKLANKKRELERKKTAYAKYQNRKVVNEILRHGKNIKTENISVKGWQKRYGKAISAKSPGFVQSELIRKAAKSAGQKILSGELREKAGGSVHKFSTQKTALSQTHLNGVRIKKSLSERVHKDVTGFEIHRDLFTAYLSRHVNDEDNLLLHLAASQWEKSEPILLEAWEVFKQTAKRVAERESGLSHSSLEQFSNKLGHTDQIANSSEFGQKVGVSSQPESPSL